MYLDCKERMSCLVLSCISNTLDTSYTSCSQNGRHVLICGRWPASRRPCAKLTNTTILSYRWFCITGLWNHDPGIPPFFVLWFWFTGFWLFYIGQKQTELMTGLMTGTQTKTIISNSRFIWMIFTHQHTWQNCLVKKVQSQNEHKSCSAIINCNHPNFSFS